MSAWHEENKALVREYRFKNFSEALAFVNRVGELAEKENHHPDISIYSWNRVRLSLYTHTENAITPKDRALAKQIDTL